LEPLPRLGKFLLALGGIGLIRLIPEMLQIGKYGQVYAALVTFDAGLALLTGAAGEGVWHGKSWARKLVTRTGGVALATSIGNSAFLVHRLIQVRVFADPILLERLLYFALCIALWPYAVRAVIAASPEKSRKSLKVSFYLWFALGFPLEGIFLAVFR
jgi:hypothetical protein